MSYVVRFSGDTEQKINDYVSLASEIWSEADADFSLNAFYVTAGNYSGYGNYAARYHSAHRLIEFPLGNAFSVFRLDGREIVASSDIAAYGTLLHEIGHHVVHTSQAKPWTGLSSGLDSTHATADWIWICRTAWIYFHGWAPGHEELCQALRITVPKNPKYRHQEHLGELRRGVVNCLRCFNPLQEPPTIEWASPVNFCGHCGGAFQPLRLNAKFCSTSHRVLANRSNKKTAAPGQQTKPRCDGAVVR